MSKHKQRSRSPFEELSPEQKERVYRKIDEAPARKIWSESTPLTVADRRRFERVEKKLGRPKVSKSIPPIERFIALPDAQKDEEVASFEQGNNLRDWHPLTSAQRRQWARIQTVPAKAARKKRR